MAAQPRTLVDLISSIDPSWRAVWEASSPDERARITSDNIKSSFDIVVDGFARTWPAYPIDLGVLPKLIEIEAEQEDEDGFTTGGAYKSLKKATLTDLKRAIDIERERVVTHMRVLYPLMCIMLERMLNGAGPDDPAIVEVRQ